MAIADPEMIKDCFKIISNDLKVNIKTLFRVM